MGRQLRALSRGIAADSVRVLVEGRREDDVRRALAATRRARPDDPLAFFRVALGRRVEGERPAAARRPVPVVALPDDPYGAA